jgi:hypothetical protein
LRFAGSCLALRQPASARTAHRPRCAVRIINFPKRARASDGRNGALMWPERSDVKEVVVIKAGGVRFNLSLVGGLHLRYRRLDCGYFSGRRSGPTGEEVAPRQCCHGLRRGTSHPPRSTAEVTVCQRLRAHPAPARSVTLSDPSRPGTHAIDFDAGFHISPRRSFCAALSTSPITLRRPFHDCEPVWLDRRGWRRETQDQRKAVMS